MILLAEPAERCERHGINPHTPRRYPLEALTGLFPGEPLWRICQRLKVSGSTYQGYACHGVLADTADKLATRAGVPVYVVWPEMVDDVIALSQRECAAEDCDVRFVGHPNRRYCSKQCRRRTQARSYRRRNPETYRQEQQRWRQRNADEWRAYNRRYQRRYMAELRRRQREEDVA